jgi:hypothetical protein
MPPWLSIDWLQKGSTLVHIDIAGYANPDASGHNHKERSRHRVWRRLPGFLLLAKIPGRCHSLLNQERIGN